MDIPIDSDGKATPQAVGMSNLLFVDCLNRKLKQAQFPRSQNGSTIRHEFVCC